MNVKETKIIELSTEDIKEAIVKYLFDKCRENVCKDDIKLNAKEIKETYSIGIYDSDTRVIGYNITAKVEV